MAFGFGVARARRQMRFSTDPGERIYAIGDVHGRYDLLRDLLMQIENHQAKLPEARSTHLVVLGDLVDRGPESAKVVRLLHDLQQQSDSVVVLHGNHEQIMLRALDGETSMVRPWMRIGGDETLRSFGVEPPRPGDDSAAVIARAAAAIPREMIDWLRALPLTARSGNYFFCHAGIRPGVPLKRQSRNDLLWIRDEFLGDRSNHGAIIVHGHSIESEVTMQPNRIGIDTGAYRTNVLTALYLEGEQREILSTGQPVTAAGRA